MQRLTRWGFATRGALAVPVVAAVPAQAATIVAPTTCVLIHEVKPVTVMPVAGTGFGPGDQLSIQSAPGDVFVTTPTDSSGSFGGGIALSWSALFKNPNPHWGKFTLTATDDSGAAPITASTTFLAANLAVATNPARARASKKVTFSFSGFRPGKQIYAHYLHNGKVTATAKFGRAKGPCGTLKKRAHFYPGRERYDRYRVQFDSSKRYSRKSFPQYRASITRTLL